jgi:threonine/homoserine/homoserine lactone efflux protein
MDAHAPLGPQMAIMLASVLLCGILVDDDYSLFAARLGRLIRTPRIYRGVNRTTGGLLIGEGMLAAIWRAL